jgi:hypothetical protein
MVKRIDITESIAFGEKVSLMQNPTFSYLVNDN